MPTPELLEVVRDLNQEARSKVRDGSELNLKIAEHGLTLFPKSFVKMTEADLMTRAAGLVCAGVYARMWGEDFPVMAVAGSGNKGIVCSVPLTVLEKEWGLDAGKVEEALALAMLFTSKTTEELGTLSAVCGCANAAGIGLACALVYLREGGERETSFAINNMVGNVTGMICDGAKIGCALKTMTSVDAAFRATALAMSGIGIPFSDGIVGQTGTESLANLGKIARDGMIQTDDEILKIMEAKS
jgi:L-cysteine desulfidase